MPGRSAGPPRPVGCMRGLGARFRHRIAWSAVNWDLLLIPLNPSRLLQPCRLGRLGALLLSDSRFP
jgi:hypothetical protein